MIAQFTPEHAARLLDAITRQNSIIVLAGLLWLVVALVQLYLSKRIEAAVTNKQHFSRLRYERELDLYRDMWGKLQTYHRHASLRFTWKRV